jgi:hypothetical protein
LTVEGFHNYFDRQVRLDQLDQYGHIGSYVGSFNNTHIEDRDFKFDFDAHYHPYVGELVERLIRGSVDGLQDADTERDSEESQDYALVREVFGKYEPTDLVDEDYPVEELDFSTEGAYSVYNWELFFHVPMTVAVHLSKNQRFEEAMRWFHYIFDPTDDSDGPTPERFWRVKPFQKNDVELIEEILYNLADGEDPDLQQKTLDSIGAWQDAPFRPHVVARYRHTAYMLRTVMAYLDNLIDWGDSLFRQDTIESINEATQLYVMAANILGPRPQAVPQKKSLVKSQTYNDIRQRLKDDETARELEVDIPFDRLPNPGGSGEGARFSMIASIGQSLYFCLPRNKKLLGYWDTVADRLFKIHNSLNLQGVFRQLPLFEPPIDPGMLAKATAAGVDIAAAVSGANQPLPQVRYRLLARKASEICQEVKSLGAGLLAALEKEDNERLAILRAQHERAILGLVESVRYGRWQEAIKSREGVEASLRNAFERYVYYERLLGKKADEIEMPELPQLDAGAVEGMDVDVSEPEVDLRQIGIDIEESFRDGGRTLIKSEANELDLLEAAQITQDIAAALESTGAFLGLIPDVSAHATPVGVGAAAKWGGTNLGRLFRGLSSGTRGIGARLGHEARRMGKMAGYDRREQNWAQQSNAAAGEINHLYKQLRAAEIREQVAEQEYRNHQKRIEHAEEIEQFLTEAKKGKKTNKDFYAWMKREVKGLHNQCFQLAFDVAKKAERALQHELGDPEASFIKPSYMAGHEGLLAGEKLALDLQRMEMAYHERNEREYELTKHVSLRELNPEKLLELRETGRCDVEIPEELFDLDGAGHYFRRIKTVALSIPSVTGPYTSVNCTLRLQKSRIRTESTVDGPADYAYTGVDDEDFDHHFGSTDAIVTSTAQQDSGMFETNLNDERYLPFEGAGAISTWQLELPDKQQFDYDTIQDVVLHMRYTAREGGQRLKEAANAHLDSAIAAAESAGSARLLSLRHEFPDQWAKFKAGDPQADWYELSIPLEEMHYPFWARQLLEGAEVETVQLVAQLAGDTALELRKDSDSNSVPLDASIGELAARTLDPDQDGLPEEQQSLVRELLPSATGSWSFFLNDNQMTNVWAIIRWHSAS